MQRQERVQADPAGKGDPLMAPVLPTGDPARDEVNSRIAVVEAKLGNGKTQAPLKLEEHRRLLPQAVQALGAMHRLGVTHGDIRADNILVVHPIGLSRVMFIDFGRANTEASLREMQRPRQDRKRRRATPEVNQAVLLERLERLPEAIQNLDERVTKLTEAQQASASKAEREIACLNAKVCTAIAINVGAYVALAYVAAAAFPKAVAYFSNK